MALGWTVQERLAWPSKLLNPALSDRAVKVGLVLHSYANNETAECWPSYATIGKLIGASPRTVRRALGELVAVDMLVFEPGKGRGKSSQFRLKFPRGAGSKVVVLAAQNHGNQGSIKGVTGDPFLPEKGSDPTLKGVKSRHPHNKDELTQRTYRREPASASDPWHEGRLIWHRLATSRETDWDAFTKENGFGGLEALELRDPENYRFLAPLEYLPDGNDPVTRSIAIRWMTRRAAMVAERNGRAPRPGTASEAEQ